jgi:hypothetical protein
MSVTVVSKPNLAGTRLELALAEDRVGHYPEFRDFFVRTFDLDRLGLAEPGYIRAPSGMTYALVFIGRSGEPFPSGLEIYAVAEALEPVDPDALDADLWAILEWAIAGVGPAWTLEDLQSTGRLYQVPHAAAKPREGGSP